MTTTNQPNGRKEYPRREKSLERVTLCKCGHGWHYHSGLGILPWEKCDVCICRGFRYWKKAEWNEVMRYLE